MESRIQRWTWSVVFIGFICCPLVSYAQSDHRRQNLLIEVPSVLCDAFLFNAKQSEAMIAQYSKCRSEAMELVRHRFDDWRSMTRADRLKLFRDMNSNINKAFMESTKSNYSKEELVFVEKILVRQPSADLEVHALRLLELTDDQSKNLRPLALAVVAVLPPRYMNLAASESSESSQKAENDLIHAKAQLLRKVNDLLSPDQQQTWIKIIKDLKKKSKNQPESRDQKESDQNK